MSDTKQQEQVRQGNMFEYDYPTLNIGSKHIWQGGVLYYENITKEGTSRNLYQHVGPYESPTRYLAYMDTPYLENGDRSIRARKSCAKAAAEEAVSYDLSFNPIERTVSSAQKLINGVRENIAVSEAAAGIKAIVADLIANDPKAAINLKNIKFSVNPAVDEADSYNPSEYLQQFPKKPAQPITLPKC